MKPNEKLNQTNLRSLLSLLSDRSIQNVCVHRRIVLHFSIFDFFVSVLHIGQYLKSTDRKYLLSSLFVRIYPLSVSYIPTVLQRRIERVLLLYMECENKFSIFRVQKQCLYSFVIDPICDLDALQQYLDHTLSIGGTPSVNGHVFGY